MNESGVVDRALGGFYVSSILSYHSGLPTEVYGPCTGQASQVLFGGCEFTGAARVNVIGGVPETNKSNFNPLTTPFWNPAAFSLPAPFTFGDEGRSLPLARDFGGKNEDFTLGKKTHLFGEKATLDFQASFFNIFNRHIYSVSSGGPNLATPFALPGSSANCPGPAACGFGSITGSSGPRVIQFGVKLLY